MFGTHSRPSAVRLVVLVGVVGLMAGTVAGVSTATSVPSSASITVEPFGTVANPDSPSDGLDVELYTLTNGAGMEVTIMTYGGIDPVDPGSRPGRHAWPT